jgi:hypothetical protein
MGGCAVRVVWVQEFDVLCGVRSLDGAPLCKCEGEKRRDGEKDEHHHNELIPQRATCAGVRWRPRRVTRERFAGKADDDDGG